MAYTFHNAKADGSVDAQITSGQVNSLFTTLTSQERIAGDQEFAKFWLSSDADISSFVGLNAPSPYSSNVFLSANEADAVGDLTGSEVRYGALAVVSCTATALVLTKNTDYELIRDGDTVIVAAKAYDLNSLTDNGDGTITVGSSINFSPVASAGTWVTSVFQMDLTTATPKPFWREELVAAGSAYVAEYATASILIAD